MIVYSMPRLPSGSRDVFIQQFYFRKINYALIKRGGASAGGSRCAEQE